MYKELIICIIIIILVVILNILLQENTKETIKFMDERLGKLEENIKNSKNDENKKVMEDIMKDWKNKKEILEYYIEHDELEKVETELHELNAKIETNDYNEGLINIKRSIFILNHINEKYKLKIQNIF